MRRNTIKTQQKSIYDGEKGGGKKRQLSTIEAISGREELINERGKKKSPSKTTPENWLGGGVLAEKTRLFPPLRTQRAEKMYKKSLGQVL